MGAQLIQRIKSIPPSNPALAQRFLERFVDGVPALDFRSHSKVLNPRRKRYDFRFAVL